VTEALLQEIRTLKGVFESARDPEGRAFAPLADAYRRAGEIQQAVRLLNEGLARHPNFVPGHVVAARLYAEQGLAEEAAIAARNALKLDGENVSALRSLLRVLDQNADPEAEEVRSQLLTLEPDFVPEEPEPASGTPGIPETAVTDAVVEAPEVEAEGAMEEPSLEAEEAPPPLKATAAMEAIDIESMAFDIESLSRGVGGAYVLDVEDESPAEETAPTLATGFGTSGEEPVIDLEDLAPVADEAESADEFVVPSGLAAEFDEMEVAAEEPVIDLESRAPVTEEVQEEEVVALAELAPEPEPEVGLPTEEPVIDLADLAPPAAEEGEVMELADLAPEAEEEPVMELADLAPEAEEEPVMELADLAPEAEETAEITMVDLVEMTAEEEEEVVIDLDALGPGITSEAEEDEGPEASTEPEAEESAERVPRAAEDDDESLGEPVYTRTLAELYVKQGAVDQALAVYRHLAELSPSDVQIARRIEELESGLLPEGEGAKASPEQGTAPRAPEPAADADREHDVGTPLARNEEQKEASEAGESEASIDDYFQGLLTWKPGEHP
jgi:tetratricopeptide (TPR) repeat protein